MSNNIILSLSRRTTNVLIQHVQRRNMPVNVPPTATGKRRFRLEVETDPNKLVNYCCGLNYHIDEPPIKLKPDSEYPDWLWNLRLTVKAKSWEMEKGTKEYYLRLAEEGKDRNYLLKMAAAKPTKVVGKVLIEQEEYIKRLRFAALAHLEDDAGYEQESMETDWWGYNDLKAPVRDYYLPKNENKVLYMDKIEGNSKLKNYWADETSSFKVSSRNVKPRPPCIKKAFQDSKRRHKYSIF